jgi:molybdopterin converting factor small subunit
MTYGEAVAREREALASGRKKAGSGLIELATGLATGYGAGRVIAGGTGAAVNLAQKFTGLGRAAPQTTGAAISAGARTGGSVGTIIGAGQADGGGLMDRVRGAAAGGAFGATAGALTGGLLNYGLNKAMPTQLDPTDIRTVFGAESKDATRAVGQTAETVRRSGRTVDDIEARLGGGDIEPELPLNVADVIGDAGRVQLRQVDQLAMGSDVSETIGRTLNERTAASASRQARSIERATGRTTQAPSRVIRGIREEKRAVDDVMFARARAAARTRPKPATTKELAEVFQSPEVAKTVRAVESRMRDGTRSGRLGPDEKFVSPYVSRAKGNAPKPVPGRITSSAPKRLEVQANQDPNTLVEISRRLGERAEKARRAGNTTAASDLTRFKATIDRTLEDIPEFAQANALSKRYHDRMRATEAGFKRGATSSKMQMADEAAEWRGGALPVPVDAQAAIAAKLGRPLTAVPEAFEDFSRGTQVKRVIQVRKRGSAAPPNQELKDLDELAFGPGPAAQISASNAAELEMARTAASSPSARGQLAGATSNEAIEGARAAGNVGRHLMLGTANPQLGAGLTAMDVIRLGLLKAARPGQAQLAAEGRGLLATDEARDAMFRLVRQHTASKDTPVRRGLFDASLYAAPGLREPNR